MEGPDSRPRRIPRFERWAERPRAPWHGVVALSVGLLLFLLLIPLLFYLLSTLLNQGLSLPRLPLGRWAPVLALLLVAPGWTLAGWAAAAQIRLGRGTPMPMVPTRDLVVQGPYAYSRNPMVLGATLYYLGLAVWLESAAFLSLTLLFFLVAVGYAKGIEEKELEARFGEAYRRYKGNTPFLIPWPRRRRRGN